MKFIYDLVSDEKVKIHLNNIGMVLHLTSCHNAIYLSFMMCRQASNEIHRIYLC